MKKFLMDAKLPDPRPLIHVCDRHDFIEEMTGYLYKSSLQKYIEVRHLFLFFVASCSKYFCPEIGRCGVLKLWYLVFRVASCKPKVLQKCSPSIFKSVVPKSGM